MLNHAIFKRNVVLLILAVPATDKRSSPALCDSFASQTAWVKPLVSFVWISLASVFWSLRRAFRSVQVDDVVRNSCLQLHPTSTTPSAFLKTPFSQVFLGVVPGWDPVSSRQFSRWRLLNPHFLRSLQLLSSLCLGTPWRRDLAHFRKIPPFSVFKTTHCVLLQVLKDFFLLSVVCFLCYFFLTRSLSPPQEPCPYPIKCHHTRWTRARVSGYIRLPIKHFVLSRDTEKTTEKPIQLMHCIVLCVTLRQAPSVVSILEKRSKDFSYYEAAVDTGSLIPKHTLSCHLTVMNVFVLFSLHDDSVLNWCNRLFNN